MISLLALMVGTRLVRVVMFTMWSLRSWVITLIWLTWCSMVFTLWALLSRRMMFPRWVALRMAVRLTCLLAMALLVVRVLLLVPRCRRLRPPRRRFLRRIVVIRFVPFLLRIVRLVVPVRLASCLLLRLRSWVVVLLVLRSLRLLRMRRIVVRWLRSLCLLFVVSSR